MRKTILLGVGLSLLAGCGAAPVKYDPQASYALNVVRAVNIDARLEDVEIPKDTVTDITDSAGYGFAMAVSGYNAPIPGFSSSAMAGMNFASWLFAPKAASARNSLFAWMPEEAAGDKPIDSLADILLEAASKAAKDMGYTPKPSIAKNGNDKSGSSVSLVGGDGVVCTSEGDSSNCWIVFGLRTPKKIDKAPEFVEQAGKGFLFDPSAAVYSRYIFPKENAGLNELELLVNTSKHAPSWLYFYVAPKKIRIGKDRPIKLPLVINQGKVHYFVTPS